MRRTVVLALALFPGLALAGGPLLRVPDRALSRVEGADRELVAEHAAVADAALQVEATRERRAQLEADRRAARYERRYARGKLGESRRAFRKARRRDDIARSSNARTEIEYRAEQLALAEDHVAWHDQEIRTAAVELRRDRAARAMARAQLELAQAELLDDADGLAPLLGVTAYDRQLNRAGDRAAVRSAELAVARAHAKDERGDYLATSR